MGKRKGRLKAALFAQDHPFCCFCGGTTPTVSIDHQPARILFPDIRRPRGLEFPACKACQEQTRHDEPLVALMAHFAGGHRPNVEPDQGARQRGAGRGDCLPGLGRSVFSEKLVLENGILRREMAIDVTNAQLDRSMCLLSAKFALAAYDEHHKIACPPTATTNTMWLHNQDRNARLAINDLLKKMPQNLSLQAGSWNTDGTFYLRYHAENDFFFSVAILHESLALLAMIKSAHLTKDWEPWSHVWKPSPGVGIVSFDTNFGTTG